MHLTTRLQKTLLTLAGFAALALGGSALAGAASNKTATPGPSSSATTTQARPSIPQHGTAAHEDQEKPVTGAAADKAKAAAAKSVGSGSTATEVETDFGGNGYEVTVKKADGSTVEVHLDMSFNVIQGGPGRHPGHGPRESQGAPPSNNGASAPATGADTVGA